MTKRRRSRADSRPQYIYDGQQLLAVVERVGHEVGCFKTRAEVFAAIDHDW
jgi:hypothetical protein